MIVRVGETTFQFDGKEYSWKGEVRTSDNSAPHGYGVGTCISDTKLSITGTFAMNKPNGFCK